MLPRDLQGPGKTLNFAGEGEVPAFVAQAVKRYPNIHPDFITDVCFEDPDRFNDYFPNFNVSGNSVVVRHITAQWLRENVRYDDNESIEFGRFFGAHVEEYDISKSSEYPMVGDMIAKGTWPFLPVIIEHDVGVGKLGSQYDLGRPFHLIEGCHRTSYLLRMLALGYITSDSEHEILEIV